MKPGELGKAIDKLMTDNIRLLDELKATLRHLEERDGPLGSERIQAIRKTLKDVEGHEPPRHEW